ncbi:putative polysaccharide biosynthesis protein [Bacillus pseudomycoides]|uniref:putative polysaccharide biosynthesis protein n=1 Tax=Bacillus pseudomycoides TaxID=64104 RepID=UPI000BEB4895|nr:polysaccharide biosynthesis protein [Bacillus pseudomycoides]PED09625.1 polysaccharide biosynthesis protein [Bacillus pseudomycoides]PEI94897.1 polysaccharide biosynthesis protein [Bacillus pseudomycoides]PEK26002.1 polysaccharide biosynthesis protein [Bacillus pseudomycoides]PEM73339.1 polysaccharide biosynthesis protein [Bacillus pseudomycoides]PEO12184.1 polysaccharide biosynthesis protein [Bacillus pseudomycoides]
MSTSKVLKGTALLSGATMISRILGFIYFFPFQLLVGEQGVALYAYAYSWYGILLSFSTAGIPIAVSKFVAKYNALGDYNTSKKLYNSSVKIMLLMGFAGFLILFIGAPYVSQFIIRSKTPDPQFIADVTLTMRALSFALIIVPAMSVTRGYFQGFEHMKPSAVSQVVEQIARVIFILVGSFIVSKLLGGSVASSVAVATFGAVIGAIASVSILIMYWKKYNHLKPPAGELKTRASNVSLKSIYMELLRYAIPIVFVGIAIPLYTLVDQYTVADALRAIGTPLETANAIFAYITNYAQKLIMIPASLATGFSLTIIPAITKSFTSGKLEELQEQITKIFQLLLFFTIPAAFGLASIAYDAFRMVYMSPDTALGGSQYLISYAPSAVLSAIFTVSAAILQGIDYQRKTMIAFSVGILVKILVNTPLLYLLGGHGAVLGTILGYLVSDIIMLYCIVKFAKFDIAETAKTVFLITIYSAAMSAVVIGLKAMIGWLIPGQPYIESLLIVIICGVVGGIVYLTFVLTSGLASHILGDRIGRLPILKKLVK